MMNDLSLISDSESISFIERKTWTNREIDKETEEILDYTIYAVDITVYGINLILVKINRDMNHVPNEELYKIVKITTNDETGKVELHSMEVSKDQARAFKQSGEWFE